MNLTYPISNKDTLINYLNDDSKNLIESTKDISQMIHIAIIGDTNTDVYLRTIYKDIMSKIVVPLSKLSNLSPLNNIHYLNVGRRFQRKHLRVS